MSNIQILKQTGTDAFSNLFDIVIPPVTGLTGFDGIQARINNFPIPETPRPNLYDIHYKTLKMSRMGSKIQVENEIAFNIRVDKNWLLYDFFKSWKQLGTNQYTGVVDEDLIPKVPVTVYSVDTGDTVTGSIWVFEDFYPIAVGGHEKDHENSDPVSVEIACVYSIMNDNLRTL